MIQKLYLLRINKNALLLNRLIIKRRSNYIGKFMDTPHLDGKKNGHSNHFNEFDSTDSRLLIERFKLFYKDVKNPPLDEIGQVYTDSVYFKDPVHEVHGIDALHAYMEEVCHSVDSGRFEYLDELVGGGCAYIKWNMYFKHPKLSTETIVVRGMSHIQFSDRIYYHEDIYDLGEMLYEHVPVVSFLVKKLKQRLAN